MDHFKGFPDLPPIWFLAAYVAQKLLAGAVPLVALPALPHTWVLAATGLGLILWSAWWFRAKQTRIEPHHIPTALIVEGPYRVCRNPIYLGLALVLLSVALASGALSAWLPVPLFLWVITRRFIRPEETALRDAFGAEAETYLSRTGRWLPGL